jgi:hypothetical protein
MAISIETEIAIEKMLIALEKIAGELPKITEALKRVSVCADHSSALEDIRKQLTALNNL